MSIHTKNLLLASFLLSALVFNSCTEGKNPAPMNNSEKEHGLETAEKSDKESVEIVIENYSFSPRDLKISPGTKVTWINRDSVAHTVTSSDDKFDSGLFGKNKKFSHVFDTPGDYGYFCIPHPKMKARIIVN